MLTYSLEEVLPNRFCTLDNLLQLYAHEINEYYKYSISMGYNGQYKIRSAKSLLDAGWGYFIVVGGEYAGFVLLNNCTKVKEGTFIAEYYIMPKYRKGYFFKDVVVGLFAGLTGIVEYRVLRSNKRALFLFEALAKRYFSDYQKVDECEFGLDYFRFVVDTENFSKGFPPSPIGKFNV